MLVFTVLPAETRLVAVSALMMVMKLVIRVREFLYFVIGVLEDWQTLFYNLIFEC